jgi:hypothetical protein
MNDLHASTAKALDELKPLCEMGTRGDEGEEDPLACVPPLVPQYQLIHHLRCLSVPEANIMILLQLALIDSQQLVDCRELVTPYNDFCNGNTLPAAMYVPAPQRRGRPRTPWLPDTDPCSAAPAAGTALARYGAHHGMQGTAGSQLHGTAPQGMHSAASRPLHCTKHRSDGSSLNRRRGSSDRAQNGVSLHSTPTTFCSSLHGTRYLTARHGSSLHGTVPHSACMARLSLHGTRRQPTALSARLL